MNGDQVKPALDDLVTRGPGPLTTTVDGELVAMNIDSGACYGLNRVGARAWELLDRPRSIRSLCDALVIEFDVAPATCLAEMTDLIEGLRAEGLVTVDPAR